MKSICFHHNDPDGRMSAAIVKEAISDCELVEIDHGYDVDEFKARYLIDEKYNKVIIVDFSFPNDTMLWLNSLCKEFIWCEHHKSAMEQYEYLWNAKSIKGLRSLDKAGCMLTWEYFNPGKEAPMSVKLIEDFDIWKFKYQGTTKCFAEALNYEDDIEVYTNLLIKQNEFVLMCSKGDILLQHKNKRVEKAMTRGYIINWEGYITCVVNTPEDISTLGNTICVEDDLIGIEVALIFYEREDEYRVSLRSIGDIDVSKIAMKYGGGGHKNASGFSVKKDERTW